jgi:hypothetical protein
MTMARTSNRRPLFCIRLSFEEKARIAEAANGLPIATYIKSLLLAEHAPRIVARQRNPVKDANALAEVLACLGASRIASNLNQLAHHANSGSFYFDRETKSELNAACGDVRVMRQLLMQALGMKLGEEPPAPQSTSQSFTRAGASR